MPGGRHATIDPGPDEESEKARTDRQLMELLGELRVVLPGAQVLLAFLLTVPFATHFDQVGGGGRIVFFVCLVLTSLATILLVAPSVYHRLRWDKGGKGDVIRIAHAAFLAGTAILGLGILAAICLVIEVMFGWVVAGVTVGVVGLAIVVSWYVVPLTRGLQPGIRESE